MSETKKVLLTKKHEITGLGSFHKVIPVGIYKVVSCANVYKIVSDGIYKGDNLPKELCQVAKEYAIEYVTRLEIKAARGDQENERLRKELEEAKQALDTPKRNLLYMFQNERTQMESWRSQFHETFSERERALEESGRLRKELEVKNGTIEMLTKQITDEVAISAAAIVERDRHRNTLAYAMELIENKHYSMARNYIAAALGQEGEGNQ